MDNIEILFFEEYKKLDNLCKDLFKSDRGVSQYIEEMECTPLSKSRLVGLWQDDYKMLKHVRWIRNNIAHNNDYSGCNKSDVKSVQNFYQKIINQKDPFSVIAQNSRELQRRNNKNYNTRRTDETAVYRENNSNADNELKSIIIKIFAIIWVICVLILFILVANNI
ncbi:DUF6548 family protein [uncultured Eubacterium sp.]|uniref:DUF6548 family protein n=1 Tax=uncultured Eubacterium sp. TaxID=165185 RepID=UPI002626A11E|nr:DUF6548 family protein [uncultured Eubacterium sp.]